MKNFADIATLYKYLEEKATDYESLDHIRCLFLDHFLQKFFYSKHEESELGEAEKTHWEIAFFALVFENGQIKPVFTRTNHKKEVVQYSDLTAFDHETYEYLVERFGTVSNPLLKAHYAHILWYSPEGCERHAKIATENYLRLISIYEKKDRQEPMKRFGARLLETIGNAYDITHRVNHRVDRVKSELKRLVTEFNFNSSCSYVLRSSLIKMMLREEKSFSKEDFKGVENVCWRLSESMIGVENPRGAVEMLELGDRVDQKLGKKTHPWRKRIGECVGVLEKQAAEEKNLT